MDVFANLDWSHLFAVEAGMLFGQAIVAIMSSRPWLVAWCSGWGLLAAFVMVVTSGGAQ